MKLPDELYWELSPREIRGCIIHFYRSEDVQSMRFGTICAQFYNVLPPPKKGKRRKLLDWTAFFSPITARRKRRTTLAELHEQLASLRKPPK